MVTNITNFVIVIVIVIIVVIIFIMLMIMIRNFNVKQLLTFTTTRVLHREVQALKTHFLSKQTFIVVCCAI